MLYVVPLSCYLGQGLRASSLQFTSPLEFNAIFRDGFPLRLELNGWSKIRGPVTAKFKHVTVIVTCTLLRCDVVTYVPARWNFHKAVLEPYPYTAFSFLTHGTLASNICLRDALHAHVFSFTHNTVVLSNFRCVHPENQTKILRF